MTTTPTTPQTTAPPRPARDIDLFPYGPNRRLDDLFKALTDRPTIYNFVFGPFYRSVLCGEAAHLLFVDPDTDPHGNFAARLLERIRAREAAAETDEERAQFHALVKLLSQESPSLPDLCVKLRGRNNAIDAIRKTHRAWGELLAYVETTQATSGRADQSAAS